MKNLYKRHRFPLSVIQYAFWLYYRFNLSIRDVQQVPDTGQTKTQPAEDDDRRQEIIITDPTWTYRHLESVAKILGCDVDQSRRK